MPKKILLADDSITIQKVVELTFSDGDYEVTAVNNGAKAIQKLSEMRPDIILSDIIMPEKNGYEVCEFVKSHPEHRNIPVVLLTGTFEPFDPDRAEKAGCDAVVTKPFESQSLIHKVEELIAAASSAGAPAATASPAPEPNGASPWEETQPPAAPPSPFAGEASFSPAPAPEPFAHDNDIFAAPPPSGATTEMPFAEPPAPAPAAPEPSPWDEGPAFSTEQPAFSGETRAFPKMSFEDMQQMAAETSAPAPPPAPEPSPWDEAPAEPPAYGGETRAFPRMSFEDMQQMVAEPAAPEPAAEAPAWEPPAEPAWTAPAAEEPPPAAEVFEQTAPPFEESSEAPAAAAEPEEPMWAPAPPATAAPESAALPIDAASLTDDQIDRIARRVVELMSDQIIRNIAWEVIPDLAESAVRERIRQLEAEG